MKNKKRTSRFKSKDNPRIGFYMDSKNIQTASLSKATVCTASIISIGTELTTGQIINRNASWISEKLLPYGISTLKHTTVPDDWDLILNSLTDLNLSNVKNNHTVSENISVNATKPADVHLLFITGGLGPTSDDFTRKVVAHWLNLELEFDPNSWQHIVDRLSSRGLPSKEIQKQQCYYPINSVVLKNNQGTANGFYLIQESDPVSTRQKLFIFVLPGPPKEIESIWHDHMDEIIKNKVFSNKTIDPIQVLSWDFLGIPESEIAEWVESNIADCPYEKAYRVHLPFVEFKLTFPVSDQKKAESWINTWNAFLEKKTYQNQNIVVLNSKTNLMQNWLNKNASIFNFYFQNENLYFANKITASIQSGLNNPNRNWNIHTFSDSNPIDFNEVLKAFNNKNVLSLFLQIQNMSQPGIENNFKQAVLKIGYKDQWVHSEILKITYSGLSYKDRAFGYFSELSLFNALSWIQVNLPNL